ncbi:uncharacterized protein RCO7_11493 [Rhynchosporium graminicola]|uniref:Uncharacterized protein n=1 Tax=Rhynchosporium graminicola TaxID=2792576 RepID=A0A1E1LNT6_9HELO|nr:uncharacterized protein RCO7_11493 [Rhynchosporium commune]
MEVGGKLWKHLSNWASPAPTTAQFFVVHIWDETSEKTSPFKADFAGLAEVHEISVPAALMIFRDSAPRRFPTGLVKGSGDAHTGAIGL